MSISAKSTFYTITLPSFTQVVIKFQLSKVERFKEFPLWFLIDGTWMWYMDLLHGDLPETFKLLG